MYLPVDGSCLTIIKLTLSSVYFVTTFTTFMRYGCFSQGMEKGQKHSKLFEEMPWIVHIKPMSHGLGGLKSVTWRLS